MLCFPGDIVKVLVIVDDVEDELFARVSKIHEHLIEINYYEETTFSYANSRIYALESTPYIIGTESICEHYPHGDTVFMHLSKNRYVLIEDITDEKFLANL